MSLRALVVLLFPLCVAATELLAAPPVETGPVGWATEGKGTTGGAGGPTIDVTDAAQLVAAVKSSEPKIVRIKRAIELSDAVRVGSNTTLIGVGADAKLVGGGLHVRKVDNVVIRNLAIRDAPDAIGVEESHHVWIDHCDLSNCKDGLVDVKRGSDFVTVSWCHFHDHHKTCLLGHSDKADVRAIDTGHLRVTYHHNFFDRTETRHPRVRYAEPVHVFNNLYRGNAYGVASVMDAGVLVEGNVFEDVEQPTLVEYGDSPDPGRLVERKNVFLRSGAPETRGTVDETRLKYEYRLDDTASIPEIVTQGAGVGRIAE
jgi:pectate lyase